MRTSSLVVLIFSYLTVTADMGTSHCLEMTITFRDGTTKHGFHPFFNLTLERDDQEFYYLDLGVKMRLRSTSSTANSVDILSTDYHLSNFVKRTLYDTLWFFDDAVPILSPTYNTEKRLFMAYTKPARKLASKDIRDIVVHRVYILSPGEGIETSINADDKSWLGKTAIVRTEPVGGSGNCSYHAILFNDTEQIKALLARLQILYNRERQYELTFQEIQLILEKLRKEKVLIASSCSC